MIGYNETSIKRLSIKLSETRLWNVQTELRPIEQVKLSKYAPLEPLIIFDSNSTNTLDKLLVLELFLGNLPAVYLRKRRTTTSYDSAAIRVKPVVSIKFNFPTYKPFI